MISPALSRRTMIPKVDRGEQFVRRTSGISLASGASATSDGSGRVKIQSKYSLRTDFSAFDDRKPASHRERPVQVQLASLTNSQLACVDLIRKQS